MKKKLFKRILLFIAALPLLTACEGLDGCEVCQLNTYENGLLIIEGAESEYCGADLIAIKAIPAEVDGAYTIKWECN